MSRAFNMWWGKQEQFYNIYVSLKNQKALPALAWAACKREALKIINNKKRGRNYVDSSIVDEIKKL